MSKKGILVVVSGFSGVGKGTLMKMLVEQHDNYALSVSATTRAPREGEENGREYYFHTVEEFQEMIRREELLEYACYCGNYYGTPLCYVEEMLEQGKDVFLEIELQGAMKIREMYPEALLLFVMPPSAQELYRRLAGRGTESPEVIEARLRRAGEEAEGIENYDYVVINDQLEVCAEEMHRLILSQHLLAERNLEFIDKVRKEVRQFLNK